MGVLRRQISVILPCYNVGKYIMRCWNSIKEQTFDLSKMEFIFVDDCSIDNTWDILSEIEKGAPDQVVIIRQEVNSRQGAARNLGLRYASAPYVAFIDSDDWIDSEYFERLYNALNEYDCDFSCCNMCRDDGDGSSFPIQRYRESAIYKIEDDSYLGQMLVTGALDRGPCAKLFKRSFLLDNKIYFPEDIAYEDICWGALLYPYVSRFYALDHAMYHYYINPSSTVLNPQQDYYRDMFTANYIKFEEWQKRGFLKRLPKETEFDFIVDYYLTILKMFGKRYDSIPIDAYNEMRGFILQHFPDFRSNPYIHENLSPEVASLIDLLAYSLTERELSELHRYLRAIRF